MNRDEAKEIIARSKLNSLTNDEVVETLSEYWFYDDVEEVKADIEAGQFPNLSEEAISILVSTDSPEDADRKLFEPMLVDLMMFRLAFFTNEYLESKLNGLGKNDQVQGDVEEAGVCPCCHYFSIAPGEDGLWDICPVCFWENGGDGPNHISLAEAQVNFEAFGAIDERARKFVDPEGPIKYARKAS